MKRNLTLKGTANYSNEEKRGVISIINEFPMTESQARPLQHFFFHFSHAQFIAILLYLEMIAFPETEKNWSLLFYTKSC